MDLTDKYTHYKKRLYQHYIAVDHYEKDGSNLPAFVRHLWGKDSKFICWGDTTIDMAYYIMYLAAEFYNYKRDNKDTSETLKRLYYALKSIERLDYKAEYNYRLMNVWTWPKGPNSEDLNGFFIRDDVPKDILIKYPYLGLKDEYDMVSKPEGFWSDDMLWTGEKNYRMSDMSQDQVWHLVQGFAFVKKIFELEGSLSYTINEETFNIVDLCIQIPKRMIDYMLITCKQRLTNPVFDLPVPRGEDCRMVAYGFAKVGKHLSGYDYYKHLHWWNKPLYKISHWFAENVLYNGISNLFNKLPFKTKIPIKNYSYRSLAVAGDVTFGNNLEKLFNKDALNGEYIHFPYVYNIIFGGKIDKKVLDITLDRLNSAPDSGPYNFGKEDRATYIRWTSSNTLINSLKCKELGDDVAHLGSYNGIDFLLLYNLYRMQTRNERQ